MRRWMRWWRRWMRAGTSRPGTRARIGSLPSPPPAKQADGWRLDQPEPGVLVWRTPAGHTYTTIPTVYAACPSGLPAHDEKRNVVAAVLASDQSSHHGGGHGFRETG
jgi:hypothetical protein